MESLAKKLATYLQKKGTINESEFAIYKYGFEAGMETMLCCIAGVLIAFWFHSFLKLIFLVAVFFPLRAYSGGIHLKNFYQCFVCSCLVMIGAFIFSDMFQTINWIWLLGEALMLIMIHFLSFHIIKGDNEEQNFFSYIRKMTIVAVMLATVILFFMGRVDLLLVIFYTSFVTLISDLLQFFKMNKEKN